MPTLTFDLKYIAPDIQWDRRPTVRVETNATDGWFAGDTLYLPDAVTEVGRDGTGQLTLAATPADARYRLELEYHRHGSNRRDFWRSDWFSLTADAKLADLVFVSVPPVTPSMVTLAQDAAETAEQAREDAEAAAAGAAAAVASELAGYVTAAGTARTGAENAKAAAEAAAELAQDISNIDTPDALVKVLVEDDDSATRGALNAAITHALERGGPINALDYGVVADGVTNDHAAWQTLVNSLEDTGATLTWTGRSVLDASILWKRGVNLVGQGWGRSVLATRGDGDPFGAIEGFSPYASTTAPYEDLLFKDFEVDGSEQAVIHPGPSISGKALFIQFMRRCQFVNLYLHDTIGTALGIDFLPDCLIQGVLVVRGGKNWTGNEGGHAGIGIGMGAWEEENVTISDCHTIDCGHWGIFVERQNEQPYRSRGAKIIGCSATGTRGTGIADVGCTDTLISGCSSTGNGLQGDIRWYDGIQLMFGTSGARVVNNTVSGNAGAGIVVRADSLDGNIVESNSIHDNALNGISFPGFNTARRNYRITNNEVYNNGRTGIGIGGSASLPNLMVTGNRVYNNGKAGTVGLDRGIHLAISADGAIIAGNRCFDDQTTKTQQYGVAISSGTWTNSVMEGNNLIGNATTGAILTGATTTGLVRRNNLGHQTASFGTATMPSGQTTVTVLHGLHETPKSVTITPQTNPETFYVTTLGASGFIVTRPATGGDRPFSWRAEA